MDMFAEEAYRLKAHLLVFYMYPKFILSLPPFPLLPSSKVNCMEFKARVKSRNQADLATYPFDKFGSQCADIIAVVSDEQKALYQAWIELLHLPNDRFGLEANFLGLGGDGIPAINPVSWLRGKGFSITVRDVLRHPFLRRWRSSSIVMVTTKQQPHHKIRHQQI